MDSLELFSNNGKFQWEIGKTYTIEKPGNEMYTDEVFHCYNHPILAVLLNRLHVNIQNPRLFEIEVPEFVNNDGLKYASKSQTLVKELDLPIITNDQKLEFAIRVAKLVCDDEKWNEWADKWLSGEDRLLSSAWSIITTQPLINNCAGLAVNAVHWYSYDKEYALWCAVRVVNEATYIYENGLTVINENLIKIANSL